MGICHIHHLPLAVPLLQRVLHFHSVTDACVTLRMKSNGGVRHILFKRNRRGADVKPFQIESGFVLDAIENGGLHFVLALHAISASAEQDRHNKDSGWVA